MPLLPWPPGSSLKEVGSADSTLSGVMAAGFSGFVMDPAKCSRLSLEEKRELVHEISVWADNAPEILQSWSRRELLQIICAEMGEERKYTGLTKPRMIARLLKLMSARNTNKNNDDLRDVSNQGTCKKKRKKQPLQLLPAPENVVLSDTAMELNSKVLCQNLACRASLSPGETFCRRCSCCICHCYDDNKDPSLWLVCNSDPPYTTKSCGISCHLSCILEHEKGGIIKNGGQRRLDGAYFCIACGKVNGLIGSWQKQLLIANEARRVDLLCQRISLSYKILKDTEQYRGLHSFVSMAATKLRKEVGPLDNVSDKMARGIVRRLSCAAEIQKLCLMALEAADSMLSGLSNTVAVNNLNSEIGLAICRIQFEEISPLSVVVSLDFAEQVAGEHIEGVRLWHRRSNSMVYPVDPTCLLYWPDKCAIISGLDPSTEYWFRVSLFSSTKELGTCEASWVMQTPTGNDHVTCTTDAPHEDEDQPSHLGNGQEGLSQATLLRSDSQRGSTNSSDNQTPKPPRASKKNVPKFLSFEDLNQDNEGLIPPSSDDVPFVCSNSDPLETPSKSAGMNTTPDASNKKESAECEYEYCVKVIRWLECEGYMEKDFRVKFLTWFSLKATMQERRVVKAFVDVLIDDPESLVDQLIDAFVDGICSKEKISVPYKFHANSWH